jgi:hypothetical protein
MKALNSFSIPRFPYFSALWRVFCLRGDADAAIMSQFGKKDHGEFAQNDHICTKTTVLLRESPDYSP